MKKRKNKRKNKPKQRPGLYFFNHSIADQFVRKFADAAVLNQLNMELSNEYVDGEKFWLFTGTYQDLQVFYKRIFDEYDNDEFIQECK